MIPTAETWTRALRLGFTAGGLVGLIEAALFTGAPRASASLIVVAACFTIAGVLSGVIWLSEVRSKRSELLLADLDAWNLAVWHWAYCRWYDAAQAGRRRRARAWGWLADQLMRFA